MRRGICFLAAICVVCQLWAVQPPLSAAASAVVGAALSAEDTAGVIDRLQKGIGTLSSPADRQSVMAFLGDYEERLTMLASAAERYREAAVVVPGNRNDNLLLDAARCYMSMGDADSADSLVRSVLLSSFDAGIVARARLYSAWIQLSSGSRDSAVALLREYAGQPASSDWAPAIYFSLWWATGDERSRDALVNRYPGTPEAAVLRSDSTLRASPFWYLMERTGGALSVSATSGAISHPAPPDSAASTPTTGKEQIESAISSTSQSARWQQTGFFRVKDYADSLAARLREKGFEPVIREEKRPSGTVYFVVLVAETAEGTTGPALKNAGFESYPVFDQ